MNEVPVITIDGPSGSGKGTVSSLLAQQLGWHLLDSGALYRLTALAALKAQADLDDIAALSALAKDLDVSFRTCDGSSQRQIFLGEEDVSLQIRTEEVSLSASKVAAITEVRDSLFARQQAFAQMPGLVADGRDMGTVVFPHATMKFYITASAEARAQRRLKQLQAQGIDANIQRIFEDIVARDKRDSERAISPLLPATDAIIIDTTPLSIEEVIVEIKMHLKHKGLL
ncbi:(d)CMP kinase [Zooshikella harenae]|uniref:Cytidylate kinase n=1 Tax=Zooshikella harenae TaxID=2827238 RepID=A0ABS5Z9A9_9GAMM|nr:(d)CMP kinase [Zooshikella harenae]MBU2710358.1 (d)CMP kinase [Zooshikella harenae]